LTFIRNIHDEGSPDLDLITRYKSSGDIKIVAVLFQRYMDLLFGVCLKYLKEPEQAKDAVMQIFEELVAKLHKHEIENFRGWLHTLAKNYCLMQLRSPRNMKTAEFNSDAMQSTDDLHLDGVMEKEATFLRMEKCLEKLPAEQEKTVRLFYLENKCYKDIAELTGIEWNKVRSFIQNGRRNLKICIEKSVIADEKTSTKLSE
jgi:RNA polymerase sigma factor (sigma-70 family)